MNLENLPKSITELSTRGFGFEELRGSFMNFHNLVTLDLSYNNFGEWLSSSPDGFQFCESIETIRLWDNGLDTETVSSLVHTLKEKPNFRRLAVDSYPLSEDIQRLVMEHYSH
ncbi:hypothetical protein G210_1391 [Candida maltosa Xu316]|uniref:Uncharacterized protein n=1 Tax=Candida maltosa (strain Xu316) TaxID=1245528 RepID=M3K0D6_CANMX|nr:hypothetical protein G210_1391 [Candida maltosa Xu316]